MFNPSTSLDYLKYVMDKVDIILLMSVNPGFGGQKFIPSVLQKAREARKLIDESVRTRPTPCIPRIAKLQRQVATLTPLALPLRIYHSLTQGPRSFARSRLLAPQPARGMEQRCGIQHFFCIATCVG